LNSDNNTHYKIAGSVLSVTNMLQNSTRTCILPNLKTKKGMISLRFIMNLFRLNSWYSEKQIVNHIELVWQHKRLQSSFIYEQEDWKRKCQRKTYSVQLDHRDG